MPTVDLNLINAKIPAKEGFIEAGISIEAGRIYRIAKPPNMPKASKTIDAEGNITLPGLIDVHVHLRDLELAYKEDFFTGTCAAAAGGFTTVLDMPNTQPPTNTPDRLREKVKRAMGQVVVNVGFYAAFPSQPEHFAEMAREGAVAFKVNLCHPATELDVHRDDVLREAFQHAKGANLPVAVHAEEGDVIRRMKEAFRSSGKASLDYYLKAHSPEREARAVRRVLNLAEQTGLQLHFCHISSASSLGRLKGTGSKATCEVTPHHLFLTTENLHALGGIGLMDPPLRSRPTASKLWRALKEGQIDILASDHAPHSLEEKQRENVWEVPPGVPGLETTLPLMLDQVNRGRVSWRRLIQLLATKPAEVFHLIRGSLQAGNAADLVVVDANREYTVDSTKFHSKAKYSPFDGWRGRGKPVKTFVNGRLVMDEGEIVASPGAGRILISKDPVHTAS